MAALDLLTVPPLGLVPVALSATSVDGFDRFGMLPLPNKLVDGD